MSIPKSAVQNLPTTNLVIDYAWIQGDKHVDLDRVPDRVDVLNISFAVPQQNAQVQFNDKNPKKTKESIQNLQKKGKHVLLSVGVADAKGWNLNTPANVTKLAQNIKKMVDEYGFDGVDIDHELMIPGTTEIDREKRFQICGLIKELRKLLPEDRYLLTYAAFSIGAYERNKNPEWDYAGSNIGCDIKVLQEIGQLLNWVNVMSYNAFDPDNHYSPIQAMEAFKSLMRGDASKVAVGTLIGPQDWPETVKTNTAEAKIWLEHANQNGYRGAMFWTLTDHDFKKHTGEEDRAFTILLDKLLPKKQNPVERLLFSKTFQTATATQIDKKSDMHIVKMHEEILSKMTANFNETKRLRAEALILLPEGKQKEEMAKQFKAMNHELDDQLKKIAASLKGTSPASKLSK